MVGSLHGYGDDVGISVIGRVVVENIVQRTADADHALDIFKEETVSRYFHQAQINGGIVYSAGFRSGLTEFVTEEPDRDKGGKNTMIPHLNTAFVGTSGAVVIGDAVGVIPCGTAVFVFVLYTDAGTGTNAFCQIRAV